MFGSGATNWYHWLVETLPAAFLAHALPRQFDDHPLVVFENMLEIPQFRESIELFVGERELQAIGTDGASFDELITIDKPVQEPINMRPGYWPEPRDYSFNPDVLRAHRHAIIERVGVQAEGVSQRLFLARENDRRPYNQEEIIVIAERHGFETIYPERLSFRDQVAVFLSASHIVGPSGAAFANTIFCRPGFRLLSWLIPQYAGFCSYANIASSVGTTLRYLLSHPSIPVRGTFDAYQCPYTIEPTTFEASLKRMLSAEEF